MDKSGTLPRRHSLRFHVQCLHCIHRLFFRVHKYGDIQIFRIPVGRGCNMKVYKSVVCSRRAPIDREILIGLYEQSSVGGIYRVQFFVEKQINLVYECGFSFPLSKAEHMCLCNSLVPSSYPAFAPITSEL